MMSLLNNLIFLLILMFTTLYQSRSSVSMYANLSLIMIELELYCYPIIFYINQIPFDNSFIFCKMLFKLLIKFLYV